MLFDLLQRSLQDLRLNGVHRRALCLHHGIQMLLHGIPGDINIVEAQAILLGIVLRASELLRLECTA